MRNPCVEPGPAPGTPADPGAARDDGCSSLFDWAAGAAEPGPAAIGTLGALADSALVAAIEFGLYPYVDLANEAARRRLQSAVPALVALCRRLDADGRARALQEQAAALRALAAIGSPAAAAAVGALIARDAVPGPALGVAVEVAYRLGCNPPADVLGRLLSHRAAIVRRAACCFVRTPDLQGMLMPLLKDVDVNVRNTAACALGRIGVAAARPALMALLRESPSLDVIEAAAGVADETCIVLLGRVAREVPRLADAALDALDGLDHPHAARVAATVRRDRGASTASG